MEARQDGTGPATGDDVRIAALLEPNELREPRAVQRACVLSLRPRDQSGAGH